MLRRILVLVTVTFATTQLGLAAIDGIKMPPDDGKLRIIAFGAHPDDCELQVGGTGAMWAKKGHHVLLVSVTNGDIGHWREAGGPLAVRRKMEVQEAHKILGVQGVILDIHDGELLRDGVFYARMGRYTLELVRANRVRLRRSVRYGVLGDVDHALASARVRAGRNTATQ